MCSILRRARSAAASIAGWPGSGPHALVCNGKIGARGDGSRRARIAYGSGVTVSQVNALLQRFDQAAKMMRRMSNKVGAGVPGFGGPAMGGGKGKGKGKKNKKKSGKSGNPMKREAEEKALRDKLAGKSSGSTGGSAFAKKPQNPALPAGLEQMMGNVDGGTELPPNLGGGLGGLFGR